MKLSFVIPAYNEEKNISFCLDAILKNSIQYTNDIEIIVVNNASTDNTEKIASAYPNIKIINEPQKGLAFARQAGFLTSTGDLIANTDADTMITPTWLNLVFKEFNNNKNLVGLSGPFIYYDFSATEKIMVKIFYYLGFFIHFINKKIFRVSAMMQGGNFIVKRTALEKLGGYNLAVQFYGEDTDIAKRLIKLGDVKFNFKLKIFTSGRRLKKEGILATGWRYALNFFWITWFKKPFTKKYNDIRN